VATASAAAVLTGLVFLAVSINLERILKGPGLGERDLALQSLLLLLSVLVVALIGLIPGQSSAALGVELLIVSLGFGAVIARLAVITTPEIRRYLPVAVPLLLGVTGSVPFVVGAVSILARDGGGLYWVFGGIVGAVVGASINAWVLMVEIVR